MYKVDDVVAFVRSVDLKPLEKYNFKTFTNSNLESIDFSVRTPHRNVQDNDVNHKLLPLPQGHETLSYLNSHLLDASQLLLNE
mgnify:CR=1 FL=1